MRYPAIFLVVLFGSFFANAATVYDGMNYTAGADLSSQNGGSGWGGAWNNQGGAVTNVSSTSLSFGNLDISPGAATTTVPSGQNLPGDITTYTRSFLSSIGADNTVEYLSFLLRPDTGAGFYGGLNLGGLFIGKSGTTTTYGLESSTISSSSVVATQGQTVLLVLKASFLAGNDHLELFVNPTPGQPEPAVPSATKTDTDLGNVSFLYINNAGGWTTDEIRLGPDFASVTPASAAPEPGYVFALAPALWFLVRRRSSK
jgi:hypothetical protein